MSAENIRVLLYFLQLAVGAAINNNRAFWCGLGIKRARH